MKKIQSLYFLLLLIPLTVVSQNSETYVSFPDVTKIYLSGDCAEVLISDSCNYLFWQEYQKKELVKAISMQKQVDKVVIRFKYTREIWIVRDGVASLVSSMDIENFDPFRWQKFTDQVYSNVISSPIMDYQWTLICPILQSLFLVEQDVFSLRDFGIFLSIIPTLFQPLVP